MQVYFLAIQLSISVNSNHILLQRGDLHKTHTQQGVVHGAETHWSFTSAATICSIINSIGKILRCHVSASSTEISILNKIHSTQQTQISSTNMNQCTTISTSILLNMQNYIKHMQLVRSSVQHCETLHLILAHDMNSEDPSKGIRNQLVFRSVVIERSRRLALESAMIKICAQLL